MGMFCSLACERQTTKGENTITPTHFCSSGHWWGLTNWHYQFCSATNSNGANNERQLECHNRKPSYIAFWMFFVNHSQFNLVFVLLFFHFGSTTTHHASDSNVDLDLRSFHSLCARRARSVTIKYAGEQRLSTQSHLSSARQVRCSECRIHISHTARQRHTQSSYHNKMKHVNLVQSQKNNKRWMAANWAPEQQ